MSEQLSKDQEAALKKLREPFPPNQISSLPTLDTQVTDELMLNVDVQQGSLILARVQSSANCHCYMLPCRPDYIFTRSGCCALPPT